jgi:uncharacterized membrane protein
MAAAPEDRAQTSPRYGNASEPGSVEELTRRNVDRILPLETADQEKATTAHRVANAVSTFAGSMKFFWINALLVTSWVVFNLAVPEPRRFDPFPFSLLTLILSVEAIFLAIFILINQNRGARVSEKRSRLDLQLNLLSEQENTKMLMMLEQIGRAVGAEMRSEPEARVLAQATQPEALSEQIDRAAESSDEIALRPPER